MPPWKATAHSQKWSWAFWKIHSRALPGGRHARPNRAANPVAFWSKFWRQRTHRRNRFDLPKQTTAADVLVIAAARFLKANRSVAWWVEFAFTNKTVRNFSRCHCVASLPDVTSPANVRGFLEYMLALASFDGIIAVSKGTRLENLAACWREHLPPGATTPPHHSFGLARG